MISVTFDSNVWEQVVDKVKRNGSSTYTMIYTHIVNKDIKPYFFEGLATLESIQKKDRKNFIKNYRPTISIQVGDEEPIVKEGTPNPELSNYLKEIIPEALNIGFKFIRTPRIAGFGIAPSSEHAATDENYPLGERLDRTFSILRFIEGKGSGKAQLDNSIFANEGGGIVEKTKNDINISDKKYAKSIAEWVDGDALAAHYGYGIDYFCTNDQARGAGSNSVFHSSNLEVLKENYGVKVITPDELLSIIQSNVTHAPNK